MSFVPIIEYPKAQDPTNWNCEFGTIEWFSAAISPGRHKRMLLSYRLRHISVRVMRARRWPKTRHRRLGIWI